MAKPNTKAVSKKHSGRQNKISTVGTGRRTKSADAVSAHPRIDLPVKRKLVWVYDTSSPEFRKIWQQEQEALRRNGNDPDIETFIEGTQNDPEVRKWWW